MVLLSFNVCTILHHTIPYAILDKLSNPMRIPTIYLLDFVRRLVGWRFVLFALLVVVVVVMMVGAIT